MKKIYIHFSIFVLFLAIILAFSGCGRKSEPAAEENLTPALSSEEREKSPTLQKGEEATSSSEVAETATSSEDVDTADWKVYKNEEYGFELRYPSRWDLKGDQLNSFSTSFKENGLPGTNLECGIFDNSTLKSPEKWVNDRDFFQLKQFENPDTYVAYGISNEIETLRINMGIELLNYKGGMSGGGTFETAIIPFNNKIIVITYSLTPDPLSDIIINEQRINAFKIFKQILKSFKFMN